MDKKALFEKIMSSISRVLDETLRSYYTDMDRSSIRTIDMERKFKTLLGVFQKWKEEFIEDADKLNAKNAITKKEMKELILHARRINNEMPKGHNVGNAVTKKENVIDGNLFMLNDESWELKEKIYQIKYDIVEKLLIIIRDHSEIPIVPVLAVDARSVDTMARVLKFMFAYSKQDAIAKLKSKDKDSIIAEFHMPTRIDDFITNKYPILYTTTVERMPLKPVEDKRIVIRDGNAWLDRHEEELEELRRQKEEEAARKAKLLRRKESEANRIANRHKELIDLKSKGRIINIGDSWDDACIVRVKLKGGRYFYNAVPSADRYDEYLFVDNKGKPLMFDEYEMTKDGTGAYLSNSDYYGWVSLDGDVELEEIF